MQLLLRAVLLLALAGLAHSGSDASLKSLYDGHRWFELRDAIQGKHAPPFYLGAAASAFNNIKDAEKYLNRAVERASNVEEADQAHGMLAYLYTRLGRSRDVVRQFDEMLKLKPGRADVLNARTLFAAFGRYPAQSIGRNRRSTVQCKVNEGGLTLPVSINGRSVQWGLDTGMNLTTISEAEARMLGLAVQEVRAQAGDLAGGTTSVRATVAGRLTIGTVELYRVPMLVVPDSQPPMNELPPGERGVIGLPVAIAFRTFRWSPDGRFEIGSALHANQTGANLCFDGLVALARVQSEGKQLDFIFDTGNGAGTQLWERFSNEFTTMVSAQGTKGRKRVTQLGGSNDREVIVLPEILVRIGGFHTALRPANVFSKPVGNAYQHGLLGMDLLTQAREVSVDFTSMSLVLR